MAIPVFSVEDLKDTPRLPERIQLVSDVNLPAFFYVVGDGSSFFFINLPKFIKASVNKIDAAVVEGAIGGGAGTGIANISFGVGDELFAVP